MLEQPEKWIPGDCQLPRARIQHSSSDPPGWLLEWAYKLQVAKSLSLLHAAQHAAELVLQRRRKWRKLFKVISAQPLSGGRILLKFSWYSEYTNSTNIWAIIQLNPSKNKLDFWCWRSHLFIPVFKRSHNSTWQISPFGYIPDLHCTWEKTIFSSVFFLSLPFFQHVA